MTKQRHNWACDSQGPQNNNLVEACSFSFHFDDTRFGSPHCPVCGQAMIRLESPDSVSRLLRKGQKAMEPTSD